MSRHPYKKTDLTMLLLKLLSVRFSKKGMLLISGSLAKWNSLTTVLAITFWRRRCDGRVVLKTLDSKSNGVSPRRFESCSRRIYLSFIFFELFSVTRNIALDFAGVRNGTKGKRGLGARKSKRLHHSKYAFQFQSPAAFYSSKVILYHVTVSVNDVHCSFPLKYDPVSWVKPLHALHLTLACTLLLAYY